MNAKHFYQCRACSKSFEGEEAFEQALYCCTVKEVWKCGACGKIHKTRNPRKSAEKCCFEPSVPCPECLVNMTVKGKDFCKSCLSRHAARHVVRV